MPEVRTIGPGRLHPAVLVEHNTTGTCAYVPANPVAAVAYLWHVCGMARIRVSTTVDEELLEQARRLRAGSNDAALLDEALGALLARHRRAQIDTAYAAYDDLPLDEPDEWGDLASFREAAGSS